MRTTKSAVVSPALFFILICALTASGCTSAALRRKQAAEKSKTAAPTAEKAYIPGVDVTEASLRGSEFKTVPELETIRFDYDSSSLSDEALAALKNNAAYLKEHPSLSARVAGYCDERGTVEYNLALGQKRAKTVREYYTRLGVAGQSVATISYGKESPVCSAATEECWTQNRRAETGVRSPAAPEGAAPAAAP